MKRIAIIILSAAALTVTAGCGSDPAPQAVQPPAPPMMMTVNINATGAGHIAYTDPAGPGGVTAKDTSVMDITRIPVSVPKGTTVRVTLTKLHPASSYCDIQDATGQLTLVKGTATCETVVN